MSFNYTKPSEVATGGLVYKGTFNASTGSPDLSNAEQGDLYVISVGGTIYGQTWAVGDHLLINEDMGGSITNSKIDKVDNTDAVTSVNGLVGTVVLSGDDIAADHTASNYTATNANIDGHLAGIDSALGAAAPVDSVNGQTGVVNIYADDSTLNLAGSGLTISGTGATSTLNADVTSVNGATGAVSLGINDLSDVDTSGITNTQLLAYNSTSGNFEPTSPTSVPDATDSDKGIIEIATNGEAAAGLLGDKALVPSNISSFSIASSQVTGLATVATSGAYANLTGTPTTATTTTEGIIATATDGETTTGTADNKALTPSNIDAISAGQLSDINLNGVAANDFLKYSGSEFEPTTDGTALTIEVVSDTSPQLGGDLDVNGNDIVSASNGDIDFTPNGTGKVVFRGVTGNGGNGAGRFQLNCENNSHGIIIQGPPHSAAANYTLTLPNDTGSASQLLSTNGSGLLSWQDALLVAQNLADLNNATTARTNLGVAIGSDVQAYDAGLDSIAGLTTAADKMIYTTASDTYAVTDLTAAGRAILDDADNAAQRTTLGLVAVASSGDASDVTSAVNPTNYTKTSNDVDGHLTGIDNKLGTILTLPTYQSVSTTPITGAINYHYSVDTSGGAIEIDLPAISGLTTGQRIYIKLKTAGNDLTLDPDGSDTIDGQSSYILDVQHSAITLVVGAGSNWEII